MKRLIFLILIAAILGGCPIPTREQRIKAQNARDGADRPSESGQAADE